jgi:nicotinamide riboside transporter PnuC
LDLATADILGHIAYSILALGMLLIAHKKISGWFFRALGAALWIYVGFAIGLTSVWIWCTIFLGMELYGYRTWRAKRLSPDCSECGRPHAPV